MKRYNLLMHKALGGGNLAQAKLAQYHHVLIRRRMLSYFYMIIVAFFMLSSTACSSGEETEKSEVFHYETTFLAHNWQISAPVSDTHLVKHLPNLHILHFSVK